MEKIDLTKFLLKFNCRSVNDCWLNTDCIIDESGITAKHSDDDSIGRIMYSQRIKLDFPCPEQRLFEWARGLDDWEMKNLDIGNQSHCVERLPKELVDKWQPVSDFFWNWYFKIGGVEAEIGTAPFVVDWEHWLKLSKWTKKEAALLVSGFEPDKFYQVESYADYQSMCEPFVKLLRLIPDDLSHTLDWLAWFYEKGYLYYAPKPLREWYEEQPSQMKIEALNRGAQGDGAGNLAGRESASTKIIQANSNNVKFSGLLNIPKKVDDWFQVIDDMTKDFYNQHKKIPNDAQAWPRLWASPPVEYEIKTGTDKGEDCLLMPGIKPLSKSAFSKRWENYTANKAQ